MKQLATNRNGIRATRHFKSTILSVAAVVLAGLALALARPAAAQYTFTTIDFPGAATTDVLGSSTRTTVGQFIDAGGNTHGWLLSTRGSFQQFDVPGAWSTSLSAISHRGDFGGVYRDDPAHPLRRHGFIVVNDVLTTIDYPGSTRTSVVQMNDRGQAVGIGRIPSEGATTPFGFIWRPACSRTSAFPARWEPGLMGSISRETCAGLRLMRRVSLTR